MLFLSVGRGMGMGMGRMGRGREKWMGNGVMSMGVGVGVERRKGLRGKGGEGFKFSQYRLGALREMKVRLNDLRNRGYQKREEN